MATIEKNYGRLDYATKGIRVNAICLGVIRTPMIDLFTGKDKNIEAQFAKTQPVGRLGEPKEIADASFGYVVNENHL